MTGNTVIRGVIGVASVVILSGLPLVVPAGFVCVLSVAITLTVYFGIRTRIVYSVLVVLAVLETLYAGMIGVLMVAYLLLIILLLGLRRFVSVPVWADHEGWGIADATLTVLVSWIATLGAMAIGVVVAKLVYGGSWQFRGIADASGVLLPLAASAISAVVVRRLAIPFRRVILFGA